MFASRRAAAAPLHFQAVGCARWLQRASTASQVHRRATTTAAHDVGGMQALLDAPIEREPKDMQPWELESHALFVALAVGGRCSTDGLRRAIEALPEDSQASWSYYELWSAAMATLLVEDGAIKRGELEAELFADDAPAASDATPRFEVGQTVTVLHELRRTQWRRPHLRTPGYIFGCTGVVERRCGAFPDPSLLAYGADAAAQHLYRVRFLSRDIWPEVNPHSLDSIDVEVYESWLLPASASVAGGCERGHQYTHTPDGHGHGHGHEHLAVEGGFDHVHVHHTRAEIEELALVGEGAPRPGTAVHEALMRLVTRKGIVTRDQIRQVIEKLEVAACQLAGASLVARAWVDPAYRQRLLEDANQAALELGVVASNPNAPTKLTVVANEADTHNLVVCTLCSCYPAALLGPSPSWYKSRSYRARAVRRPRELLREAFALEIPPDVKLRVHDSTADLRYLVLPLRPNGTDGWSEEQLRGLVTRDSMIGVTVCEGPSTTER